MKILVADDERLARERLISLLRELGITDPVGEAANGEEALREVVLHHPEIVLLDIRMPDMDGMEAARHLGTMENPPAVIFVTAYDKHAIEAFETCAIDYLLKPVRRERLRQSLEKADRLTSAHLDGLMQTKDRRRRHISATLRGNLKLVPVDKIRYFQAGQKYVTVGYPEGTLLIEEPLKSLEEEFGDLLIRIHRNALVAERHITALERGSDGTHRIHLRDVPEPLEVSRRLLAGVKSRLRGL